MHPSADERPVEPSLRRVLDLADKERELGILELLTERLSGADLTTLLLEVFRRRAERVTPAEVLRRYQADRFVGPAAVSRRSLLKAEQAFVGALPPQFEMLTLAPLAPLATHSAVAGVDPRKVVATMRGTEVAADPTTGLALEAAVRRAQLLASDTRSAAPVHLAASQRVVRAQLFTGPGRSAHFQLFGMVSAGRDVGSRRFESEHLVRHLRIACAALTAAGAERTVIRVTALDASFGPLIGHVASGLADLPGVSVREDSEREAGRRYYSGLCFKVHADDIEIGDGGFTDWTAQLLGNRKERLLTCGFGLDVLAGL